MAFDDDIERAIAAAQWPTPSAVKRGRTPLRPYVPILKFNAHTSQIKVRAYATREEAVACAARYIEQMKQNDRERLRLRFNEALREQYGLPRKLPEGE